MPPSHQVVVLSHLLDPVLQRFAGVMLDSSKIVDFVRERRDAVRSLTFMNSEGYWAGGFRV